MNHLWLFIVTVSCIYLVYGQGEESVPCKVKFMGTACPLGRLVCEEDGDCLGVNQVCCYDGCGTTCHNKTTTLIPSTTQPQIQPIIPSTQPQIQPIIPSTQPQIQPFIPSTQPQIQRIIPSPELLCPVVTVRYAFCRFSTYTPCHTSNDCAVPGMKCCPDVCGKRCKFPINSTDHQQFQQTPLKPTVPLPQYQQTPLQPTVPSSQPPLQPTVPSPQSYNYKGACST
nr:RecName: Full=Perlwapin-like protein; Flags: Precursor [Lottia gigantea]